MSVQLARLWRGRVCAVDADEYVEYQRQVGPPGYRVVQGCRGLLMLGRQLGPEFEVAMLTFWTSRKAIASFAGDDVEKARYYEHDFEYLIDPPELVSHYRVEAGPSVCAPADEARLRRGYVEDSGFEPLLRERKQALELRRAQRSSGVEYLLHRRVGARHEVAALVLGNSQGRVAASGPGSPRASGAGGRDTSRAGGREARPFWEERFQILAFERIRM